MKRQRHDKTVSDLEGRLNALHTEKFLELENSEIDLLAVYPSHVRIYEVKGRHTYKGEAKARSQLPRQLEDFYDELGHMPVRCYYYSPQKTRRVKGFKIWVS